MGALHPIAFEIAEIKLLEGSYAIVATIRLMSTNLVDGQHTYISYLYSKNKCVCNAKLIGNEMWLVSNRNIQPW